jgi:hypothetical protein
LGIWPDRKLLLTMKFSVIEENAQAENGPLHSIDSK